MRAAAIQTTATGDRDANLLAAGSLVEEAVQRGADLVVLPEHFSIAGGPDEMRAAAEPLDGTVVTWASDLARRHRIRLVAGTFPERPRGTDRPGAAGDRVYNTSCLFDLDGTLAGVYRKVHLFDVSVGDVGSRESDVFEPGDSLCAVPLGPTVAGSGHAASVVGLSICYDLRFPELYRALALDGASVVAVPAAFTALTGPAHWELLLRARAVENALFVVAANQVGDLPPGLPACHGHSMIVDPWGTVITERGDPTPGVIVAELDDALQRRVRRELPVLASRRPDAYRGVSDDRGREEERYA